MDPRYLPKPDDRDGWYRQVISECAEVTHAITKIQQFGLAITTDADGRAYSNHQKLISELHDLQGAMDALWRLL